MGAEVASAEPAEKHIQYSPEDKNKFRFNSQDKQQFATALNKCVGIATDRAVTGAIAGCGVSLALCKRSFFLFVGA